MLQIIRPKQELNALVADVVARQLKLLDVSEEIDSRQMVQVAVRQLRHVLSLECLDLLLECE